MNRLLIENGRVIDPSQQLDRVTNLLIENGKIAAWDAPADCDTERIDARGRIVAPGLVDLGTQLREPGCEEDETIETGTAAALAGGYTSIACLPNTMPPIDTAAGVEFVRQKAARARSCNVFVVGCVSKDRAGEQLAEIGSLAEAGAVAFSDAPRPIKNAELLRRAFEYCSMFDKPILNHPETLELSHDGMMHEGRVSLVLGLAGMPSDAEDVMTSRDLRLAEATGGRLHLLDVSCASSIDLIRRAKARGVRVSAGMLPPNFCLTDESLRRFDANFKLNPPLRSAKHVEACLAGLVDGTIDVIASGHAPRAAEKKMLELDRAPFGAIGLETALAVVVTKLIQPGLLSWSAALEKLTINPARVLGIPKGTLRIGADADVTIIDPDATWTVSQDRFRSKSSNSPFLGWQLQGRVMCVLVGGALRS
jgi:dihydroorotase